MQNTFNSNILDNLTKKIQFLIHESRVTLPIQKVNKQFRMTFDISRMCFSTVFLVQNRTASVVGLLLKYSSIFPCDD